MQTVSVPLVNDRDVEEVEMFLVEVMPAQGEERVDINSPITTVSITNDDGDHKYNSF